MTLTPPAPLPGGALNVGTTGFPAIIQPFPNITPFTYRDGLTWAETLEQYQRWILEQLVPHVDAQGGDIAGAYNAASQALSVAMADYRTEIASDRTAFETAIASDREAFDQGVAAQNAAFEQYTNAARTEIDQTKTDTVTAKNDAVTARNQAETFASTAVAMQDAAFAALLGNGTSLPANNTVAALIKAIQIASTPRNYGPRLGVMGDSITDSSLNQYQSGGQWWAVAAGINRKFWTVIEAGVSGETTTSMLARIAANFPAGRLDIATILGGTNDIGQGFTLQKSIDNITAMVEYLKGIGVMPILATIPPRAEIAPVAALNDWIKKYGAANNLTVVDFFAALVDPATQLYKAGLTGDGIHPTPAGHKIMANTFIAAINPYLTNVPPQVIPTGTADARNLVPNGYVSTWSNTVALPTITAVASGTDGTLSAGTYYYKAGYVSYSGESLPTNEVAVTVAAGQSVQVTVPVFASWAKVVIYRGTVVNGETYLEEVTANGNNPLVYVDRGTVVPTQTRTPAAKDGYTAPANWGSGTGAGALQLTRTTSDPSFTGIAMDIAERGYGFTQITNGGNLATVPAIGDTLAVSFKVKSLGGQINLARIHLQDANGSDILVAGIQGAQSDAMTETVRFYAEIPVTVSVPKFLIDFSSNGGPIRVGDVGIINATAAGVR